MAGCPNETCKENLEKEIKKFNSTLYGDDGLKGLVAKINEKVSSTSVRTYFLGTLSVLVFFIGYGLNAWSSAREERIQNKTNIEIIQNKLETIEESMKEIKEVQAKILNNQINPKELLKEIKDIVEKNH